MMVYKTGQTHNYLEGIMNYWNYRIMRLPEGWGIFEVYYDENDLPVSSTIDPEFGYFETKIELVNATRLMYDARFKDTLTYIEGSGFSVLE